MSTTKQDPKFPLTLYGIPCREIYGSGVRSYSQKDSKRTRILECAWENCDKLAMYMTGYSNYFMKAIPATLPGFPGIVCTDVQVTGMGKHGMDADGMIAYDWARLTCTYSAPDHVETKVPTPDPITKKVEPFLSESFSASGEMLDVKKDKYKWAKSGKALKDNIAMFVGSEEINITLHKVQQVARDAINGARGKVNSHTFRDYGPGKVLFLGADSARETNTDGTKSAVITLKFLAKDTSWNYKFNPESNEFEAITPLPYKSYNLNTLLAMGGAS